MTTPTACPACHGPMQSYSFERKPSGMLDLDLCFICHGIWFDAFENDQLAPAGVIELFKVIHARIDQPRQPRRAPGQCPRCGDRLLGGVETGKNGSLKYERCLQNHGRFVGFAQFLVERGFVRYLSGAEIDELKTRSPLMPCADCGEPLDLRLEKTCRHCGTPAAVPANAAIDRALTYHPPRQAVLPPLEARPRPSSTATNKNSPRTRDYSGIDAYDAADLTAGIVDITLGILGE